MSTVVSKKESNEWARKSSEKEEDKTNAIQRRRKKRGLE